MIFILQTSPQRTIFVAPPTSFVVSAPNEDFGAERCPDFRLGPAAAGPELAGRKSRRGQKRECILMWLWINTYRYHF